MKKSPTTSSTNKLRIPNWLWLSLAGSAVLAVIGYFVIGWIISSKLLAINPQKVEYDQTIVAIDANSYTTKGSAYDIKGIVGGIRSDGSMLGILSAPTALDARNTTSTRTIASTPSPSASVGEKIALQGNIWTTDPLNALGIAYENIQYQAQLGAMDAWLIRPATSSRTWTIGVHGIGADKTEMLRFVRPVLAAENTMMVINYRNDASNPRSPDGQNHLSDTEWQDLQAAVRYAKAQGATTINLYGDSLGGSVVQNYLSRAPGDDTSIVNKVLLDSPALDWKEAIEAQLIKAGYPSQLYYPASTLLAIRAGVHVDKISTKADELKHRTLIIHSRDDKTVPQTASVRLAAERPDLVTLEDFGSGGHLRSWNYDQKRYEKLVTDFLSGS